MSRQPAAACITASLLDLHASDGGRLRLDVGTWTALGIPFHRPVLVTCAATSHSQASAPADASGAWSFLCTSSLLEGPAQAGSATLDPRVLLPPPAAAPSDLRKQLPEGTPFAVSVKAVPSAAVNAEQLQVRVSPGLNLALLQVKLHQTLVTPGCCVLLDPRQYIQVIAAQPAAGKGTELPLYRILASTKLVEVQSLTAVAAAAGAADTQQGPQQQQDQEQKQQGTLDDVSDSTGADASTGTAEEQGAGVQAQQRGSGDGDLTSSSSGTPGASAARKPSGSKAGRGNKAEAEVEGRSGKPAAAKAKKKSSSKGKAKKQDSEEEEEEDRGGPSASGAFGLLSALGDE